MKKNILGTEKTNKLFVKFAIPAVLSMLISGTQSMIDGIFLGTFVGTHAMASVTMVQPFVQFIVGTALVICMGALSLIGRKLGEKKIKIAQTAFRTSTITILIISTIILIVGVNFSREIALLLGANDILIHSVSTYVKITSWFAPIMSLMFIFGFTNRLIGRPDLYLKASIFSLIINVSLDYLLIKTFKMGIKGAALATGIAFLGAFIVTVIPLLKTNNPLNIFKGRFSPKLITSMVYNGSSEAVTSIAIGLTIYLFNVTFLKLIGTDGVVAFTVINYIAQVGTLLMFGISDGIGVIISYNYGNRDIRRVKDILKLALKVNLFIGGTIFLLLIVGSGEMISLFIKDNPSILRMASKGAKIYGISFLMSGFNIIISAYFTSIGKAKESVIIAGSRGIVFMVMGITLLPKLFNVTGIWLTVPFAEGLTLILSLFLLKKSVKKLENF